MSKLFKFKQFSVMQDRCAMKIGTDSVLLGSWASKGNNPGEILDIGAGTGVLSLMLAQRFPEALVEAIEIDDHAYEQCVENFEASPWSDRLFCYHASLLEYIEEVDERYGLIICNPPFYSDTYKTQEESRNRARFKDAMPFEHLLHAVSIFLSENGVFAVIIPFSAEDEFINLAEAHKLYPIRLLNVKGHTDSDIKRSLIEFSKKPKDYLRSVLTIENGRHNYTEDYIKLTKDFYLKM